MHSPEKPAPMIATSRSAGGLKGAFMGYALPGRWADNMSIRVSVRKSAGVAAVLLAVASPARAQVETVMVTAARLPEPVGAAAFSTTTLDSSELVQFDQLDAALEQVPGLSLFRRSTSLNANATTEGVSLREIAPSGTSRALVMLDGVPLNDPFGGWVIWSASPVRDPTARARSPARSCSASATRRTASRSPTQRRVRSAPIAAASRAARSWARSTCSRAPRANAPMAGYRPQNQTAGRPTIICGLGRARRACARKPISAAASPVRHGWNITTRRAAQIGRAA